MDIADSGKKELSEQDSGEHTKKFPPAYTTTIPVVVQSLLSIATMTEPAPKRAKMATGQSASTSTGDTQGVLSLLPMDNADSGNKELSEQDSGEHAKVPKKWFEPSTQDFKCVTTVGAFVDHSLLIAELLKRKAVLITAPRRFGKTINVSMVRRFVEIQCDENRIPIKTPGELTKPVTDTANYKLFKNLKIMQQKYTTLVKEHFGRHPVIYLDMKGASICNADDVLMHCRTVLHEAFTRHEYLHGKLGDEADAFVSLWCHEPGYLKIPKAIVQLSLLRLATYLHTYFQRKVFILVDEYDYIATEIISQCTVEQEIRKGINIYMAMLGKAIKSEYTDKYIQATMLTGISYVGGMGLSAALNNVQACRFLGYHGFVKFYGLTESELQCIVQKYATTRKKKRVVKDLKGQFNGYESQRGERIYSIWSVGNSLQNQRVDNYWRDSGRFHLLQKLLTIPQISVHILELLNGKDFTIKLKKKIYVSDLVTLYKETELTTMPSLNLIFSMMLEEGYLTVVKPEEKEEEEEEEAEAEEGDEDEEEDEEEKEKKGVTNKVTVRLPNREIKSEIRQLVTEHFVETCGFNEEKIEQCANFFNDVKSFITQNQKFKHALKKFHKNLTELCEGFSPENIIKMNEAHLHCLLYLISSNTGYRFGTEVPTYSGNKKEGRVDLLLLNRLNNFGIIVELKYNKTGNTVRTSSRAGLEQILSEKTEYMSALTKRNIEKYFLMSISIDQKHNTSISCLLNSKEIGCAEHLPINT